jgi:primosomal protein N' (replication factor Y)
MPDQPAIKYGAQADYPGFYRQELEYRQLLKYPPFSLLVSLTLSGHNLRRVAQVSRQLGEELSQRFPALEVIGPKVKPGLWKKVQKEVKLYLRLAESKEFFALSQFLEDFSHQHSQARLSFRIIL